MTTDELAAAAKEAREKPTLRICLDKNQIRDLASFIDDDQDDDTRFTIAWKSEWKNAEDGVTQPAGFYAFYAEHPDEGLYGPLGANVAQPEQPNAALSEAIRSKLSFDGENQEASCECVRCGRPINLRDGSEPTPECDPCAQQLLHELRGLVEHATPAPSVETSGAGDAAEITCWFAQHPTITNYWLRFESFRQGKLGYAIELGTFSWQEAKRFNSREECEEWIVANPTPVWVPSEHFIYTTMPKYAKGKQPITNSQHIS